MGSMRLEEGGTEHIQRGMPRHVHHITWCAASIYWFAKGLHPLQRSFCGL